MDRDQKRNVDFYNEKQNYYFINFRLSLVHGNVVIFYIFLRLLTLSKLGVQGLSRFLSLSLGS